MFPDSEETNHEEQERYHTGQNGDLRGPLALYIDGLSEQLHQHGYAAESVRQKCVLLADFSQWL